MLGILALAGGAASLMGTGAMMAGRMAVGAAEGAVKQTIGLTKDTIQALAPVGSGGSQARKRLMERGLIESGVNRTKQLKRMAGKAAGMLGVNLSLASILKQSQIFTGVFGTVFQILGAFIDIMLIPLMPVVKWLLNKLIDFIPSVQTYAASADNIFKRLWKYLQYIGDISVGFFGDNGFLAVLIKDSWNNHVKPWWTDKVWPAFTTWMDDTFFPWVLFTAIPAIGTSLLWIGESIGSTIVNKLKEWFLTGGSGGMPDWMKNLLGFKTGTPLTPVGAMDYSGTRGIMHEVFGAGPGYGIAPTMDTLETDEFGPGYDYSGTIIPPSAGAIGGSILGDMKDAAVSMGAAATAQGSSLPDFVDAIGHVGAAVSKIDDFFTAPVNPGAPATTAEQRAFSNMSVKGTWVPMDADTIVKVVNEAYKENARSGYVDERAAYDDELYYQEMMIGFGRGNG